MNPIGWAVIIAVCLFVGTMICLELGYRLAHSRSKHPDLAHEGTGAMEAAVFALLGLLLGFSFAGGTSRLDSRRELIIREANAIGTAYLRLDLLLDRDKARMRALFREYLDARLSVYRTLPDLKAAEQELARVARIQENIWSQAVIGSQADPSQTAARLLLPAINEMIDVTASRTVALYTHLPLLIFLLLIGVTLVSGLLAGYGMAKRQSRSWLHMVVYALVVSITVYAVADLDNPRAGLIRLDAADAALSRLQDSIR